jgi:hypothetical protein
MKWLLFLITLPLAAEPRLLDPQHLQQLRKAIAQPGTHREIYQLLRAQLAQPWFDPKSANWNYGRAYHAVSAAFAYQLTREKQHCEVAYQQLRDIHDKPDPDRRLPNEGYGLGRATVGLGFAYGYDWCSEAWSPAQNQSILARIKEALDDWPNYKHANLEAEHRGSNWVSVCRGGELILMLAAREEKARAARFAMLKDDLRRHMQNFDELGVSQEGIGYTAYGGIFLMRALLALRAIGDTSLEDEAAKHAWWKQAMYAGSFAAPKGWRVFLMSGVSGPGIGDEGWTAMLIPFVPRANLKHYLWWFDRHMGSLSPEPRFEPQRDGRVWSLLCYPIGERAEDPTPVFPKAITGAQGLTFFRNRWKDKFDLQISLHADAKWHSHAWDQPEALQLGILADGILIAAGPEKDRDPKSYSKPLVNGRVIPEGKTPPGTGSTIAFELAPDGGYVAVEGGSQYEALGVKIERQLRVKFEPDGSATAVIIDRSDAPVTWNLSTRSATPQQKEWLTDDRAFRMCTSTQQQRDVIVFRYEPARAPQPVTIENEIVRVGSTTINLNQRK